MTARAFTVDKRGRKHEVRRKRQAKRVAWLVVSDFRAWAVFESRVAARGLLAAYQEGGEPGGARVVRVEYDWPPVKRRTR